MKKATECKRCKSADLYHGAYCRPCWRIREREIIYGKNPPPPKPRTVVENGDPCPGCGVPVTSANRHHNFSLCHPCGVLKHRKYQQTRNKARKPKPEQQPKLQNKRKPVEQPTSIIVPRVVKITLIPSACPSFRDYREGPNFL